MKNVYRPVYFMRLLSQWLFVLCADSTALLNNAVTIWPKKLQLPQTTQENSCVMGQWAHELFTHETLCSLSVVPDCFVLLKIHRHINTPSYCVAEILVLPVESQRTRPKALHVPRFILYIERETQHRTTRQIAVQSCAPLPHSRPLAVTLLVV